MVGVAEIYSGVPEEIVAVATRVITTFAQYPADPVVLDRDCRITSSVLDELVRRHARHGFALAQLPKGSAAPGVLLSIGHSLGGGPPFEPPLYSEGAYIGGPVNTIAATGTATSGHPSFERASGVDLHCDGTLQWIGHIATSLLLCRTRASEGGETVLFNTAGAFAELAARDQAAAIALATPGVLVRQANINGRVDEIACPVVATKAGRLVCCYSVGVTDRWEQPDEVETAALTRGLTHMARAAAGPSPYITEFVLDDDQLLILDNSLLSHGRRPYRDAAGRQRCLFRSLHLERPGR